MLLLSGSRQNFLCDSAKMNGGNRQCMMTKNLFFFFKIENVSDQKETKSASRKTLTLLISNTGY